MTDSKTARIMMGDLDITPENKPSKTTVEPHKDITTIGNSHYYLRLQQGSPEWHDLRKGILTASTMNTVITPATLKTANNKETRTSIFELAAQRVSDIPPDNFTSYAMERGNLEEMEARLLYSEKFEPVYECGFVINDSLGFPVGFSPDGLVGLDGSIENKSRAAKFQMQTIIEHLATKADDNLIPKEFMLQVQTGLWVTQRKWMDFTSYSNGLNMVAIRVEPIQIYQEKIAEAAVATEELVEKCVNNYRAAISDKSNRIIPVKWVDHNEEIQA
jgi:hypothetical protein